jgi:phosphonate transport system substrate-binding protein
MKHWTAIVCFLTLLMSFSARAADYLILGVQDYVRSPILVVRDYEAMRDYLSKVTKQKVRVEAVRTYDEYMQKAKEKRYAFMYAPPSMIMKANKLAGYQPVVRVPGLLSATFFALSNSGIAFPEDMKGKRIGFYEKDSMITQLALASLRSSGIDPDKYFKSITYYSDSNGVLSAMQYNLIDVAAANSTLFTNWTNKGYDLNVIMQTKGMPHLTLAVRGDLPESLKNTVTDAMLKADKDKDMQTYFRLSGFQSFEPAKLSDYDELVKTLNIH